MGGISSERKIAFGWPGMGIAGRRNAWLEQAPNTSPFYYYGAFFMNEIRTESQIGNVFSVCVPHMRRNG